MIRSKNQHAAFKSHRNGKMGLPLAFRSNGSSHHRYHRSTAFSPARLLLYGCIATAILLFLLGSMAGSALSIRASSSGRAILAAVNVSAYEIVTAGAGPAGLSAAVFAARAGLSVLVIGSDSGSLLSETVTLDNFPSFSGKGQEWLAATKQQAVTAGVDFVQAGILVTRIHDPQEEQSPLFALDLSSKHTVHARAVIVATGSVTRRLNLEYEAALWGKAVHSCAICDGSSYVNKTVVVVGGGDAAVDSAILLSRHAASVTVIHRRDTFRASNQVNLELMRKLPNVHIQTPYSVHKYEVNDQQELVAVHVRDGDTQMRERISCDGAFLMIGSTPNTAFLKGIVQLDSQGLIVSQGKTTVTSVPGIFAAGEVTDDMYRQAITAAAAGSQAAIDAERWLRQRPSPLTRNIPENIPLQKQVKLDPIADNPSKLAKQQDATTTTDCDLGREECITALVNQYPVVVFSKPWCPYCKKALEALSLEGVVSEPSLHVVNLEDRSNARQIQNALGRVTGRRTVPNVFIGGTSIGGGDETVALHTQGKLRALLVAAGAVECDLREAECIRILIQQHPVVVFSKPWCPYCRKALEALSMEGIKDEPVLHVVDLTNIADKSPAILDTLKKLTGRHSVPNVFVGGKAIGGGDETAALGRAGKLHILLERAKAYG